MKNNKVNSLQNGVEDAKRLYFKYNCSMFGLERELGFNNIIRESGISDAVLLQWGSEFLKELYEHFITTGEAFDFVKMGEVFENHRSAENLAVMKKALDRIVTYGVETNAMLSETLLGRRAVTVRDGLVFTAFDMGEYQTATDFLKKAKELLSVSDINASQETKSRIERDVNRCKELEDILNDIRKRKNQEVCD